MKFFFFHLMPYGALDLDYLDKLRVSHDNACVSRDEMMNGPIATLRRGNCCMAIEPRNPLSEFPGSWLESIGV